MRTPYPALIAALLTTGPTAALAQAGGGPPLGDPAAGRGLAERVCWACHVIPDWEPPAIEAPGAQPFEELAADPAVTGMALYAFLRSSHPTMPNFIFSDEELNDIIAYILSLKKERAESAGGTVTRSTITRRPVTPRPPTPAATTP